MVRASGVVRLLVGRLENDWAGFGVQSGFPLQRTMTRAVNRHGVAVRAAGRAIPARNLSCFAPPVRTSERQLVNGAASGGLEALPGAPARGRTIK